MVVQSVCRGRLEELRIIGFGERDGTVDRKGEIFFVAVIELCPGRNRNSTGKRSV